MRTGPRRTPLRRRGVALAVVAVLVLIVSIAVIMLQRASRQRYWEGHRHTSGEIATALAESGVNAFLEALREGVGRPDTELYATVVEADADTLNRTELEWPIAPLEEAAALLDDASAAVTIRFQDFRPYLPAGGVAGLQPDPREKYGVMLLEAAGTYRGVTRRYRIRKRLKVVSATLPALSKFTLFVTTRGDQEVNRLAYNRLQPEAALRDGDRPARPLVVFNTQERTPILEDSNFLPMRDLFSDTPPDGGGLVYLGGDRPWYLNLTHGTGAGPFDELFHLRRTRYLTEGPDGDYLGRLWFGFYDGILQEPTFPGNLQDDRPPTYPTGEPVSEGTAALHLFGEQENVTPTVVLGQAFRSYVQVPLRDGLWFPYLSEGEFDSYPGGTRFGSYAEYAEAMVRVEAEAFNRSYDYLLTNSEILTPEGLVEADGEDGFEPPRFLTAERLTCLEPAVAGDEHFLYPTPGEPAPGAVHLFRSLAEGRESLFRGSLADVTGEVLGAVLAAKAVESVASQAEFEARYLASGVLEAPGVVLVEKGPLTLGKTANADATMVVVRGDVVIDGWLAQGKAGHPLTVVSLGGNLTVSTSELVQASLVALDGEIRFPVDQVNLLGQLVAQRLDLASLVTGEAPKWLTYNHDLDPTVEASYRNSLRCLVDADQDLEFLGH